MLTEQDIYMIFQQEQSKFYNRGFRTPKNWDRFFAKLSLDRKEPLITITKFFNTKWSNIDPALYFETGFQVYGARYSYNKFFDKKVIDLYINKDRQIKRELDSIEDDLSKSVDYVDRLLPDSQVSKIFRYSNMSEGAKPLAISDYLSNRIGKYFLVYLMKEGYVKFDLRIQSSQLVYINEQYNKYLRILNTYLQKNGNKLLEKIL